MNQLLSAILVVLLVTSAVECQLDEPVCNWITGRFIRRRCAARNRYPCGILNRRMKLLSCRRFGCENYRDIDTFCTRRCDGLEIANGICPWGDRCCLPSTSNVDTSKLTPIKNSKAFDLRL